MINARHVEFTGRKMKDKQYYWHTMHPGGLKTRTPKELAEKDKSEEVRVGLGLRVVDLGGRKKTDLSIPPPVTASAPPNRTHPNNNTSHTTIQILRHAVIGMLPKNSLRHQVVKKLRVFPDEFHPYEGPLRGKKSII